MQSRKDFSREIRFWKARDSARWDPIKKCLPFLLFWVFWHMSQWTLLRWCRLHSLLCVPTSYSLLSPLQSAFFLWGSASDLHVVGCNDAFQLATHWFPWLLKPGVFFACLAGPFGFLSRNTMVNLCCPLDCYWGALGRLRHTHWWAFCAFFSERIN